MRELKQGARVAVIGQGAREHAIVWKLAQSPLSPKLFALPGNPGIWGLADKVDVDVANVTAVVEWAKDARVDLVVVGPEQPLAEGVVDALTNAGIPAFGPCKSAAELEASKSFAKQLMKEANVPTARFDVFTEVESAKAFVRELGTPIVIKADGLAAGKGVVIAGTVEEADATIVDMLEGNRFGASGSKVVIEEYLSGLEVSLMYFVDGETAKPMVSARDFKRIGEGDTGPNTGGMGAFAPVASFVNRGWTDVVTAQVVRPTIDALKARGITYRGVLYAGLMVTEDGPKVIEFNARFGDPETEVVLPLLETDLLEVMWAVAHDRLTDLTLTWSDEAAVCVVLAGKDYPAGSDKGTPIELRQNPGADGAEEEVTVFHAGTALTNGQLVTAGGRVLTVSAKGRDIPAAQARVYGGIGQVHFNEMQYRRDIAHNWRQ